MIERALRRPRLLVLASTYPRWRGDPEPGFVHELARRLAGGFEVHVLAPHARGAAVAEDIDGVRVHRYRYAPGRFERLVNDGGMVGNLRRLPWLWLVLPWFLAAQALATWRLLRELRPDVVHVHWLVPQGAVLALLAALRIRVPAFAVTSHGADLFALRGRLAVRIKQSVAARAAQVTVVSAAMRDAAIADRITAKTILVRPMGVDLTARFVPEPAVARAPANLLFVGRLVEKKGLPQLFRALPAIRQRHPQMRLDIAGFGPQEIALRKLADALGITECVHFLGAVAQADLPDLYRRATLFVAPFVRAASGDQEGLGLVVVEALGCGCPVLVGDVPAVHDAIGEEGATVVDATDIDALARAVSDLLADPALRAAQAAAGRRHVLRHFDWEAVAAGYAALLGGLIAPR